MNNLVPLEPVDYLVVGHISQDLTPSGLQLGGTATYSALTAQALGLRVGMLTAIAPNTDITALQGIVVISTPSEKNTIFENIYTDEGRRQVLHHQATPLSFEDIPDLWRRAEIIHLGPVAKEMTPVLPESVSPGLLGLTPQGWMRTWDLSGRVERTVWENAEQSLTRVGAVVISIEDVGGDEELVGFMAQHTRVLAVTEGAAGTRLYWHGDQRRFRPPKMYETDSTGAGDIFAAAFFIRLKITQDPWEAARFATHLSAYSVTRKGLNAVPTADEIQACMVEVF